MQVDAAKALKTKAVGTSNPDVTVNLKAVGVTAELTMSMRLEPTVMPDEKDCQFPFTCASTV